MRAGKVWMQFDDGTAGWVPVGNVKAAMADGGTVAPKVRMRVQAPGGPLERDFPGARVPFSWQEKGEVVPSGEEPQTTSGPQAALNISRGAVGGAIRGAGQALPAFIPGAGLRGMTARFLGGVGENAAADVGARAVEGAPFDPAGSAGYGALVSAAGLPFEGAALLGARSAPETMAGVLRPTKTQQVAAEQVAARQGQTLPVADYERLGKQALAEGVRPQKSGAGAKVIESRIAADNATVEGMIDQAGQMGIRITAPQLARSPEVRQVMRDIRMEGDPKESLAQARAILRGFMQTRASAKIKPKPTGVLNSRGQMGMTPGQPAIPEKMTPTRVNEEKRVWRKESAPVLRARKAGTAGPAQGIEARIMDALARAARSRIEALPVSAPDPMDPTKQINIRGANERIESRKPLKGALQDFNRRVPPSKGEQVARLMHGHLLAPESEAFLAQKMYDPAFQNLRNLARYLGLSAQDLVSRGNE